MRLYSYVSSKFYFFIFPYIKSKHSESFVLKIIGRSVKGVEGRPKHEKGISMHSHRVPQSLK